MSNVEWNCFSCGKFLGTQGAGGSFDLHFGYGSGLDMVEKVNGWICDECVAQKHGRLRVSNGDSELDYWDESNQIPLLEHESTSFIKDLDYFGRNPLSGWAQGRNIEGFREYESITSEERGEIESLIRSSCEPLDWSFAFKLAMALLESESARVKTEHEAWEARICAAEWARSQAQELEPEELERIGVRYRNSALSDVDIFKLWAHSQALNERCWKLSDKISALRAEIKELKKDKND